MNEPRHLNGGGRLSQPSLLYSRSAYSSTGGSPPDSAFRTDAFGQVTAASSSMYGTSPTAERHVSDRTSGIPSLTNSISDPASFGPDVRSASAIIIRRLPQTIGHDALGSMLIFAGDMIDTEFIRSPYPEDRGFATARARFMSLAGAIEAQQKLHGKPNSAKEANMIVELQSGAMAGSYERRATIDGTASRGQSSSASSGGSMSGPPGRSRYGSAFQSNDKMSPPLQSSSSGGNGEFPAPEMSAHFQSIFSPTSPIANGMSDHHRVSGKTIINDSNDDETSELLNDPAAAFARNGHHTAQRRATNPAIPVTRFASLSVSTSAANGGPVGSPPSNGVASPRNASMQSPISPTTAGSNGGFNFSSPRHQYPPINPADQNPPCNTLYVGNLPIDTSEDELKAVFSKQRGYKRLCFRTKHNGPMCFVEFEDISFATKALNELYGHPLHNSIKGGIRLSFSKNPLGVRSGQTNGMGLSAAMSPHAMAPGYANGMVPNGSFSAVSGPPPGLPAPGMVNSGGYRSPTGMDGMFANPFGMSPPQQHQEYAGAKSANAPMSPRGQLSGGVPPPMGNGTFGRDPRDAPHGAYSDFMMGR